jgi:hypothetical protein
MGNKQDQSPSFLFTVHSTRMDYRTLVEAGIHPPIAFKTKADLDAWVMDVSNELEYCPIGARDIDDDVAVVDGRVGGLFYSQIWVRAAYRGYRSALKFQVSFFEGGMQVTKTLDSLVSEQDADHAVGRARLTAKWPDAWVNLMLVGNSLNRAVGAALEKDDLTVTESQKSYLLDVPCLMKLFLPAGEEIDRSKVQSYFERTRKAFINNPQNEIEIPMFAEAEGIYEKIAEAHVPPLYFQRRFLVFGAEGIRICTGRELFGGAEGAKDD